MLLNFSLFLWEIFVLSLGYVFINGMNNRGIWFA